MAKKAAPTTPDEPITRDDLERASAPPGRRQGQVDDRKPTS